MSGDIPDTCPDCGHDERAFVRYEPDPNPSQTPFVRHSPPIYAVMCQDCGRVHAAITGDENGREAPTGDDYKVDGPVS